MINALLWLAISVNGLKIYPSAQQACEAAAEAKVSSIYQLKAQASDACCEKDYPSFGQDLCKKDPKEWDCSPSFSLARMKCDLSPTYKAVSE